MERPHQSRKEDLGWTNPLNLPDFRQKYLFRVYSFYAVQYLITTLVIYIFSQQKTLKKKLQDKPAVTYAFIPILLISYGLLYIKRFNHPDRKLMCSLMQAQFTIFLAISLALIATTFDWFCFSYASALLCLSCLIICIGYRFFSFEFHHYHGIRFIFYFQCWLVGGIMLSGQWIKDFNDIKRTLVRESLDGLIVSALVTMFLALGTVRLTKVTQFIKYKLDNFFFGATLIYTTPILKIYYGEKK